MRNQKTVLLGVSTLLMGLVPLIAFRAGHAYHEIVAGVSALLFLFAAQELNRAVLEESSTRKTKAYRDFVETVGLFTVIAAGLIVDVVPLYLSLFVLVAMGVSKIYIMELSKRFRRSFSFYLGEKYWIVIAAATYLLASANTYFLFYGYLLLSAVLVYDLLGLFRDIADRSRV